LLSYYWRHIAAPLLLNIIVTLLYAFARRVRQPDHAAYAAIDHTFHSLRLHAILFYRHCHFFTLRHDAYYAIDARYAPAHDEHTITYTPIRVTYCYHYAHHACRHI
jgi:hypothetical protein